MRTPAHTSHTTTSDLPLKMPATAAAETLRFMLYILKLYCTNANQSDKKIIQHLLGAYCEKKNKTSFRGGDGVDKRCFKRIVFRKQSE